MELAALIWGTVASVLFVVCAVATTFPYPEEFLGEWWHRIRNTRRIWVVLILLAGCVLWPLVLLAAVGRWLGTKPGGGE